MKYKVKLLDLFYRSNRDKLKKLLSDYEVLEKVVCDGKHRTILETIYDTSKINIVTLGKMREFVKNHLSVNDKLEKYIDYALAICDYAIKQNFDFVMIYDAEEDKEYFYFVRWENE